MADRARAFLDKLRNDTGIRGIMKQYKWRVGKLIELSPTEHTILGYNRSKGQVIALRLRTDDFDGFRHYDTMRKVLLHELAHMVWSEHDENFHALNRRAEHGHCRTRLDVARQPSPRCGGHIVCLWRHRRRCHRRRVRWWRVPARQVDVQQ
ncbi:hypothetical protein AMAG_18301 [Allomyces macrogynus ATCC 38327]|uniref:WLM domain-containing protein n=1 Tax=Allomyces macrogynus (strain ATCC 38327) TaxID=578462 RepID=A0A0L0S8F9_ALLM3|nr:hypothetical protein AMAG_18301 [Allomyces macrogynus ATCC 38327]|eukprot:KNE58772.1 hypothetical protein AMAG_18301 [Allomyces macrogynus ATCC 38327]